MNERNSVAADQPGGAGDIGMIDLMIVLAKHKRKLILYPLVAAVAAAAISLALPDVYKGTAKLLPPQQSQSGATALLSQLGGVVGMAAGAAGLKNPNDLYIGMLKSRTIADRLIGRFDLKAVYDTPSQENARATLEARTIIASGKDGLISVEVEDTGRERAAQLTNAYAEELLRLTKNLAITEAAQRRIFFEQQVERSKEALAKAEMSLKGGLDKRGVISVDAESRAIVEIGAHLKAQVSSKEIQLNSMKAFMTPSNPAYQRVVEELNSLKAELSKIEYGRNEDADAGGDRQGGLDNVKLMREVKYHQALYELLVKQYEVARLDEAKEPSLVQVLDAAVVPERKARPMRALIVLIAGAFAFFACLFVCFVLELRERAVHSSSSAAKWRELESHLKLRRSAAAST